MIAAVAITASTSDRDRDEPVRNASRPLPSLPAPPQPTSSVQHRLALPVSAYHVAVDRTHVYWTEPGGDGDELWRAPLATGVPERLSAAAGFAFALDGDAIYYTSRTQREIHRLDLADRSDRVLARTSDDPLAIVVGGSYVYWTVWQRDVVQRVATGGGAVASLPVAGARDPIAADDEYLYAANNVTGRLIRVAHGEARPRTLASGVRGAFDLVVVGNNVYFTRDKSLYRLPSTGGVAKRIGTGGESHALTVGPDAVYWTSWADDRATPPAACDKLQLGVLRRVDALDDSSEVIESSCTVRGAARSTQAMILVNLDGLVDRNATCGDAAVSARDLELAYRIEGGEAPAVAAAGASRVADAVRTRCTADTWSQPVIDCYAFPRQGQAHACETLLPPAQRARLTSATPMMTSRGSL